VFTQLSADFTGLPVKVSIGDDTPLAIAAPKGLSVESVAAVRHWVGVARRRITAHWRGQIGSVELN
jgi:hypothetical protein